MGEQGFFYQELEQEAKVMPRLQYIENLPMREEYYCGKDIGGAISYLGETEDNYELAERLPTGAVNPENTYRLTGIRQRQVLTFPEGASRADIMFTAALDNISLACLGAGWLPDELDAIIIPSTVTPYKGFAQAVAEQGVGDNVKGIDIACGCASSALAFKYIFDNQESFYGKKVVVAPTEPLTKFVGNQADAQLFSDLGVALSFIPGKTIKILGAVQEEFPDPNKRKILQIRTDYNPNLLDGDIIEYTDTGLYAQYPQPPEGTDFVMNGQAVYKWAIPTAVDNVRRVVEETDGLTLDDISVIAPHQFNGRAFEKKTRRGVRRPFQDRLGREEPKFYWCSENIGNAGSASPLFAYLKAREEGLAGPGKTSIIVGFGAGPISCAVVVKET